MERTPVGLATAPDDESGETSGLRDHHASGERTPPDSAKRRAAGSVVQARRVHEMNCGTPITHMPPARLPPLAE